jgi:predicted amidohydrolase
MCTCAVHMILIFRCAARVLVIFRCFLLCVPPLMDWLQAPAPTIALAEIDLDWVDTVRRRMPVAEHRRPDLYAKPVTVVE